MFSPPFPTPAGIIDLLSAETSYFISGVITQLPIVANLDKSQTRAWRHPNNTTRAHCLLLLLARCKRG